MRTSSPQRKGVIEDGVGEANEGHGVEGTRQPSLCVQNRGVWKGIGR